MRRVAIFALALFLGNAQEPFRPSDPDMRQIQSKLKALTAAVNSLRAAKVDDDLLVDVEVCQRAAENILRFPEEFFGQQHVVNTLTTLDRGLDRAQQVKAGKPMWTQHRGRVSRAYRSRVDGVPQPYRLNVPDSYDSSRPSRLYVYLHGRGETDFEVNWMASSEGSIPEMRRNYIRLEVYGRSNNGYHWAGETDVFEAIASVKKRYNIDPDRIVLQGFSMGAVGSWHIGLHHPGEFAALEAGAGNTKSRRNFFLGRMPPFAQATMRIYESMMDYALNIVNLPTVGYGGEIDHELRASVNVREQLEREGFAFERQGDAWKARDLRALFLVGPKTDHKVHADSRRLMNSFLEEAATRGRVTPDRIRFVTYTTRYNRSYWVTLAGMQQHYQRAEIDALRDETRANYTIKTKNVSSLFLADLEQAKKIVIDGEAIEVKPTPRLLLESRGGHWKAIYRPEFGRGPQGRGPGDRGGRGRPDGPDFPELRKRHGLQGPIDDAFMESFLCVRPTGQALNTVAGEHARKELDRFSRIFAKYFRGEARVKDDTAITAADIADNNLVLFGDPGSNKLLAKIVAKLPVRWTKETVSFGDRTYNAAEHVPVLIYPNPLNPRRYVVINTGHTAEDRDYRGGDYLQPRFGDFAVLKINKLPSGELATDIAEGGLFDEAWKLPSGR